MPEDKEPKTVDIDTSGPGADVEWSCGRHASSERHRMRNRASYRYRLCWLGADQCRLFAEPLIILVIKRGVTNHA